MRLFGFLFYSVFLSQSFAQDSAYSRKVIRFLTSEKCYGRGYLKNGLGIAADYIVKELKNQSAQPLITSGFFQPFEFNVNTFPNKMKLLVNGQTLKPGIDYIPNPESRGLKGNYVIEKKDSINFIAADKTVPLNIRIKKKLTYSVALESAEYCTIQLLNRNNFNNVNTVEIDIQNKLINNFKANNICCYIEGKEIKDSTVVFSAHYDHLGGLGKHTFFPGANDNASGVSVLLNLVRYYKLNPPKYRTVFIFFAGEEAGLIGSHYFVESKVLDLKKIKFLINLDLLGTGDDGIMVVNGAIHEKQFALLNKINSEQHLVKEVKKRGKAQNSDHYWFSEAGVPCFFVYTLGGVTFYHDVNDIEKTLPLSDYNDVFKLIVDFVKAL